MVPGAIAAHAYRQKYEKAKALFDERCKTAGEKIYRTVENVEGVLLVNTRGKLHSGNTNDQNWEGAGFPGESSGNQYIFEFLYYNTPAYENRARDLSPKKQLNSVRGYHFVEIEESDGRYRYTMGDASQNGPPGSTDRVFGFDSRELTTAPVPRYTISYENIPDPEGRAHWVAGGKVKIVDRTTNEILGEFTRYSFDTGLGGTGGFRDPWGWAATYGPRCPQTKYGLADGHIRSFVEQVIKPKQGN